jgi:hypothetical protein
MRRGPVLEHRASGDREFGRRDVGRTTAGGLQKSDGSRPGAWTRFASCRAPIVAAVRCFSCAGAAIAVTATARRAADVQHGLGRFVGVVLGTSRPRRAVPTTATTIARTASAVVHAAMPRTRLLSAELLAQPSHPRAVQWLIEAIALWQGQPGPRCARCAREGRYVRHAALSRLVHRFRLRAVHAADRRRARPSRAPP